MTPRRRPTLDEEVDAVLKAIAANAAAMRREAEQASVSHDALRQLAASTEEQIARLRGERERHA